MSVKKEHVMSRPLMSVNGPKRTFRGGGLESAFGGKADSDQPLLIDLDL
jgi:hypothetical protein